MRLLLRLYARLVELLQYRLFHCCTLPCKQGESKISVRPAGEQDDVEAERRRVENLTDTSDTPILIRDLRKVYPGLDGGKPKVGCVVCCGCACSFCW